MADPSHQRFPRGRKGACTKGQGPIREGKGVFEEATGFPTRLEDLNIRGRKNQTTMLCYAATPLGGSAQQPNLRELITRGAPYGNCAGVPQRHKNSATRDGTRSNVDRKPAFVAKGKSCPSKLAHDAAKQNE